MKKAFTLLEVVISITIFMILLLFLYKVLDHTKISNKHFKNQESYIKYKNHIYSILVEDILEKTEIVDIKTDNDKNSLLRFKSSNSFHNPYFNNITYMISSNNKLIRIESKDKFKFAETEIDFFDNAFIDILLDDIEYFEVKVNTTTKNKSYVFAIKQKDKQKMLFNTYEFYNEEI